MKLVLLVDIPEDGYIVDKLEQLKIFTFAANLAKYHLENKPELGLDEQINFSLDQLFAGTNATLGKLP